MHVSLPRMCRLFVLSSAGFSTSLIPSQKAKDEFRESRIELETVEGKLRSLQAQRAPDISALYLQQVRRSWVLCAAPRSLTRAFADASQRLQAKV